MSKSRRGSNISRVTAPFSYIRDYVEGAMICNELERIRLYQGDNVSLSADWKSLYNDVPDLHYAAFYGDLTSVKRLIKAGSKSSEPIEDGPKLLKASKKKDEFGHMFVGFFLGTTPLMLAAQQGHLEVVKYLLDISDVDCTDSIGLTPLSMACSFHHLKIVQVLLSHGADINSRDFRLGMTPFLFACFNNDYAVAKYLVQKDANTETRNTFGLHGIHYAAWNYNMKLIKYLLDRGVDVNVADENGNTPLHALLTDRNFELDGVNNVTSMGERRYLDYVLECMNKRNDMTIDLKRRLSRGSTTNVEEYRCLMLLIKRGASINAKNRHGQTPLHVVCMALPPAKISRGIVLVEEPKLNQTLLVLLHVLLKLGGNVEEQDDRGNTLLNLCVEQDNRIAIELIHKFQVASEYPFKRPVAMEDDLTLSASNEKWKVSRRQSSFEADIKYMANAVIAMGTRPHGLMARIQKFLH